MTDTSNKIYSEISKRLTLQEKNILKFLIEAKSIEDVSSNFNIHRNTASKIIHGLFKSVTISRGIDLTGSTKYKTTDFGQAIIENKIK